MLQVVFNIEVGNYYSKSTFIMILTSQEKLVFMLVILYAFGSIYVFLQNCLQVPGYPKISNFRCPVPKTTENAQRYSK